MTMRDGYQTPDVEIGRDRIFVDLGLDDAYALSTCTALGIPVMKTIREKGYAKKRPGNCWG